MLKIKLCCHVEYLHKFVWIHHLWGFGRNGRPKQLLLLLDCIKYEYFYVHIEFIIVHCTSNIVRLLRTCLTISALYYIDVELVNKMFCWRHECLLVRFSLFDCLLSKVKDCFHLWLGIAIMMPTRTQTDWLLLFWFHFCFKSVLMTATSISAVDCSIPNTNEWTSIHFFRLHCWFYILHVANVGS